MHLLTGIQDERGNRYATFRYDSDRSAIGTEHGGAVEVNSVSYSGSASSITKPLGAQVTVNFTTINGRKLPLTASQPACAGGLATKSFAYDANTNLTTRQDFRGTRSCSAYDNSRRLETVRVEGLDTTCPANLSTYAPPPPGSATANVVVQKTTSQWHPFWHFKAREASPKRISTWVYNGQPDPTNANAILTCAPSGATVAGQPIAVLCKSVEQATTDETGGQGFGATPSGAARMWQYMYNANGQRLTANGPRTDVADSMTWTYYATTDLSGCSTMGGACRRAGDLWKTTNALDLVTEIVSYDMAGRIARSLDPNATITDRSYDARGWLKDSTIRANASGSSSPFDATTSTRYIATGEIERIIRPDATFTRYEYDLARRLTDAVDPAGNRAHYQLDGAGNRIGESFYDNTYNPSTPAVGLKRSIASSFDQLSRLKQVRDALNRPLVTYQHSLATQAIADGYDDNGNAVHTIDGNGTQADLSYDALNRLIQTIADLQGTDPSTKDSTTQVTYDARGNVRKFTDADGVVTTYQSDGFDQQTVVTSPDSGTTSYAYDSAGNQISKTDNRAVVSTTMFDALNRPIGIAYPTSSEDVTYGYDEADSVTGCSGSYPIGHLTTIADSSGTTRYCYDRRGNITAKTQVTIGKTFTVAYTFNKASDIETITYPGGSIMTYARDAVGRINAVTWKLDAVAPPITIASAISYYPFGPANALTYGNGRSLVWTYDKNYAIDSIVSSALDGLSIDFSTDVMGSITAVNESSITRKYVHDRLGRLIRVDDASNVLQEGFAYTKGGDRILKQRIGEASQSSTYVPETHRLDTLDGVSRTYDDNGNTTDLGDGDSRTYDDRNRLVGFGSGIFHGYTYTAKGERVMSSSGSPTFPGGRSRFVYDERGLLLSQRSFSNLDKPIGSLDHIYVNGTPIAQVVNGAISYLEADHLGTPRIAAKPSTNAQQWGWSYTASAFGDHEATNAPVDGTDVILRYAGQVSDGDGIYYNYLRDYESATGRYLESDPIGMNGGPNNYAYASSSPLRYIDPMGLEPDGWGCLAGGVIGTTIGAIVGGAICWETGPGLLVCAGEGAALGGGLLGCAAGMATPWPQDELTSLERRAFSRHCLMSLDPCADLKAAAQTAIFQARIKMTAMLVDNDKMYLNHFATKWTNHANDLRGRLDSIAAMISLGQKMGCDMSDEILNAATLFLPLKPL